MKLSRTSLVHNQSHLIEVALGGGGVSSRVIDCEYLAYFEPKKGDFLVRTQQYF